MQASSGPLLRRCPRSSASASWSCSSENPRRCAFPSRPPPPPAPYSSPYHSPYSTLPRPMKFSRLGAPVPLLPILRPPTTCPPPHPATPDDLPSPSCDPRRLALLGRVCPGPEARRMSERAGAGVGSGGTAAGDARDRGTGDPGRRRAGDARHVQVPPRPRACTRHSVFPDGCRRVRVSRVYASVAG